MNGRHGYKSRRVWQWLTMGCGVWALLAVGWLQPAAAHHELDPPQDVAEPQYAPPPPPQTPAPVASPCPRHHRHGRRCRMGVSRRAKKPMDMLLELGKTRIWLHPTPTISHMLVDIAIYKMSSEHWLDRRVGLTMGGSLGAVDMRFERWIRPEGQYGDIEHQAFEAAPMSFRLGGRHWTLDATTLAYRNVIWTLPASQQDQLWRSYGLRGPAPDNFGGDTPMYLTPGVRLGARFGLIRIDAGIQLLDWHLGSYRATGRVLLKSHSLRVSLETIFQQDQLRLKMKASKEHKEAGASIRALWQRANWDTQLMVEADLLRLFTNKFRKLIGPLHAVFGVRYRHVFHHALIDQRGAELFREPPGGQWSFTVGLKLAFGNEGLSRYR